ncbi:MAG: class II aldolase/adducin family protein [Paenibacillus macerans]|nr:class II aldolase/adducin family protein [Paenibacillus macerans]
MDQDNAGEIRQELCKYARKIVENGLVVGPGGNISARAGDKMYLSPSGFALEEIEPEQWIEVDIPTGQVTDSGLRPSSEVLMHLYGYRQKPDIGAMVHTHPPNCIAFTLIERELPIMFPDQAALVGRTAYIPYLIPTTDLLADAVAAKVGEASSKLRKSTVFRTSRSKSAAICIGTRRGCCRKSKTGFAKLFRPASNRKAAVSIPGASISDSLTKTAS